MVRKSSALLFVWTALSSVLAAPSADSRQSQVHLGLPSSSRSERYDGHQVWRVDWSNFDENIKGDVMAAAELLDLDIWRASPSNLDVRLAPHHLDMFRSFLPSQTNVTPFISDLQSIVDASVPANYITEWNVTNLDSGFHDNYHSLDDLYAFGDALVEAYPDLVESFDLGLSDEGRVIRGWRAHCTRNHTEEFGHGKGKKGKGHKGKGHDEEEREPLEFIVQSGQHPREWVGPSSAMYFLHWLLVEKRVNKDGRIGQLLDGFTFTIVPTINPDGYVFSHEYSRMWRKNRQDTGSKTCSGIDLNSNWGYKWRPSKATPCSDSYAGTKAFQAPEIEAMAKYLEHGTELCLTCPDLKKKKKRKQNVKAFVDLHSYGQLFMFPFAHSCNDFPPDAEMLLEAGLGVAKVMSTHNDEGFEAGQACALTYRAPGDSIDYTYGIQDVRWSYSAELRDTGTYGFMLPPSLIRPSAEEMTSGLEFLAWFIYKAEIGF